MAAMNSGSENLLAGENMRKMLLAIRNIVALVEAIRDYGDGVARGMR
jgi:hypothetical protein